MREGWGEVTLGSVTQKRTEFTPVEVDEEYVILGVQRSGWGFVRRDPSHGRDQRFTKLMRVEQDDLVYRTITAFEAPSAVAGLDQDGLFVTPQTFPVFRIDRVKLLPNYMALLTTWPSFHKEMSSRCTGTVLRRKTLSVGAFQSIPILLPPLEEQRRIVDLIGAVDDTIAAERHAATSLRHAAVGIIGRPDHHSPTAPLGSVFNHVIGGAWGAALGEDDVDVLALGPKSYAGRTEVAPETATPRSLSAKRAADRVLAPGDIVIERSGGTATQPVGRVIRMTAGPTNIVPSDFQRLLRANPALVDPSYVFWQMWANYEAGYTVAFQKATTNIRNLNIPNYLAQTSIPLPSLDEQRLRADLADCFTTAATQANTATDRLRALRSNLLTVLLSGEHETPESYDELMETVG